MAQDHFERHNHNSDTVDWNFNVTFGGEPALAVMAQRYRPLLTRPELYEPIPVPWLHATILRVGTVDAYTEAEMLAVAEETQRRVATLQLPAFRLGPPVLLYGNVCFRIEPEQELEKLYSAVTQSLQSIVGPDRATKSRYGHFIAHMSLVYTKERDNEQETEELLRAANIPSPTFRVSHMPLIKQRPVDGYYQWEVVKVVIV